MIFLPLALLWAACLVVFAPSESGFAVGAFVGSVVGCYATIDLLFGRCRPACGKLMAAGFLLGYGLTSFFTWLMVHSELDLSTYTGESQGALSVGLAVVCFASAILLIFAERFEPELPLGGIERLARTPAAKWFVLVSFVVISVAFATGALAYMGSAVASGGRLNVLGAFAQWLLPPAFGIAFAVAFCSYDKFEKGLFGLLAAALVLMAIPLGRRYFLTTLLTGAFVARYCPFSSRGFVIKRLAAAGLCIALAYAASVAFMYVRYATWALQEADSDRHSLGETLSRAGEISRRESVSTVTEDLDQNATSRGFILTFLADLIVQSESHETAHGQDLGNSLVALIPRVVVKDKYLPPGEEDFANSIFGTAYPDQANSVMTGGVIDFGLLGAVFLYPLGAAFAVSALLRFMAFHFRPITYTVVCLAGFDLMMMAEEGVSDYTAFIRNAFVFAAIIGLVGRIRPQWRGADGDLR